MPEFALIDLICTHCAIKRDDVRVGIGDDAAVLSVPSGHELVVSTDTLIAGVHFPLDTKVEDIGWKALAVNLSDLAAMGATPAWATLALTLPSADSEWITRFAKGFAELAAVHNVALVGGDTTQGPLSITLTIHGFAPIGQAILRSTAKPGDLIYVTGTLGDAAAGLVLLKSPRSGAISNFSLKLVDRLNRPLPRILVGQTLRGLASAAIDISDGLLADLGHICTQSALGAEINVDQLPCSEALTALFNVKDRCRFQLSGGDDYELCFTVEEEKSELMEKLLSAQSIDVTCIGKMSKGKEGITVQNTKGEIIQCSQVGWEHFKDNTEESR